MQMLLFKVAQTIMNVGAKTGIFSDPSQDNDHKIQNQDYSNAWNNIFAPVVKVLDTLLLPIIILLGTAGTIYAIVLGVNFAKAETADKREEAKKRMINAIIGLVVTLVLLILLKLFTNNAEYVASWINTVSGTKTSS